MGDTRCDGVVDTYWPALFEHEACDRSPVVFLVVVEGVEHALGWALGMAGERWICVRLESKDRAAICHRDLCKIVAPFGTFLCKKQQSEWFDLRNQVRYLRLRAIWFIQCSVVMLIEFASPRNIGWTLRIVIVIHRLLGFLRLLRITGNGRFYGRHTLVVFFIFAFGMFINLTLLITASRLNVYVQLVSMNSFLRSDDSKS